MTEQNYESLPQDIKDIVDSWDDNKSLYEECARINSELEKKGWSCDYGLDGMICDVFKIGKNMYTVKRSEFIEWKFEDAEDFYAHKDLLLKYLKEYDSVSVQELFDNTGYIPTSLIVEEVEDKEREFTPNEDCILESIELNFSNDLESLKNKVLNHIAIKLIKSDHKSNVANEPCLVVEIEHVEEIVCIDDKLIAIDFTKQHHNLNEEPIELLVKIFESL